MSATDGELPDYESLDEALNAADLGMSAAEAHGLVTGAAVSPQPPPSERLFFGSAEVPGASEARAALVLVDEMTRATDAQLRGLEFAFEPLLPAHGSLPDRVDALADWCRGFVFGLAAGGVRDFAAIEGEAGEFLQDALQIGEAQADPDESPEDQERELTEIVEYVRIGVQLVYEDLHGRAAEAED